MTPTTFIYGLIDPRSGVLRYFGKADDPQDRFKQHLRERKDWPVVRWIKKLRKSEQKPKLHVFCEVPQHDFARFERAFIALGRQHGFGLLNITAGGNGKQSGHIATPETCAKLSAAGRKRKHTPEDKAKIREALRGKPKSKEHTEKNRLSHIGLKQSVATCAKKSAAFSGEGNPNFGKPAHSNVLIRLREKRPDAGSKFFGISWCCATKKWKVQLSIGDGVRLYLGCFSDEVEAARVYDAAVKKHKPPFAKLNFPG